MTVEQVTCVFDDNLKIILCSQQKPMLCMGFYGELTNIILSSNK